MPHHIYTYDSGRGWEPFNDVDRWHDDLQSRCGLHARFFTSAEARNRGLNPWGAGTQVDDPEPLRASTTSPGFQPLRANYPIWEAGEVDHADWRAGAREAETPADLGIVMPLQHHQAAVRCAWPHHYVLPDSSLLARAHWCRRGAVILHYSLYENHRPTLEPDTAGPWPRP